MCQEAHVECICLTFIVCNDSFMETSDLFQGHTHKHILSLFVNELGKNFVGRSEGFMYGHYIN
jgi:hypothetical protein